MSIENKFWTMQQASYRTVSHRSKLSELLLGIHVHSVNHKYIYISTLSHYVRIIEIN